MLDTYFTIGIFGQIQKRSKFEVMALSKFNFRPLDDGSLVGSTGTRFFPSRKSAQNRIAEHQKRRESLCHT